ncbi:hypothetical protein TrST_g2825 [Triparma strigata]|uniref:MAPEG family protein n=1 Tax=Triparma strigata TaxID=1606541 RepID=A0A9W7AY08_9STRA|nr:hypothetical protein TrST_g2825 [Triparma strigata]
MGLLLGSGITLTASSYAGVVKFLTIFPLLVLGANVGNVLFVKSAISNQLITMLPVPVEKVPALVIIAMVILSVATGIFVIIFVNIFAGGYDNSLPRKVKGPALADSYPALFRLQSAHNNTIECLAMVTACFWAATTHSLDAQLFAKLALSVLASRLLYVVVYVLDEDFLRTSCYILAIAGMTDIAIGAVFPETLSKYD